MDLAADEIITENKNAVLREVAACTARCDDLVSQYKTYSLLWTMRPQDLLDVSDHYGQVSEFCSSP